MKIKILVKLGELILGTGFSDDEPRADMYLPIWLLAFAMLLLFGGVGIGICAIISLSGLAGAGAIACEGLGVLALLCWKNQAIRMLSEESFEYSTFLGNKMIYQFSDIKGLRENQDSMTLFVADGKVHIESCAVVTERLANRINEQLEKIDGDNQ